MRTLHKMFGKSMLASICIVGALIVGLLPAAVVGAGSSESGFHISQWSGETWEEIYQHQFQVQYSTEAFTVDVVDGKVALRIVQVGTPFADIDQISLMVDGEELTPEYARYTESGQSIVEDILELDHNVVLAHEQEIEVSWDVPAGYGSVTVYLTANEYGHGLPLRFPETGYATYEVGSNIGSITVDGLIPETDRTVPLYCPYWQPSSGHPDGYTYIYVCDDEQYVYFSLDVTADNTNEYGEDWAEIRILQPDGSEQPFRIDDFDGTWGESGFGLTSKVTYKHQTYEFAIPKSLIDDNNIKFSLAYYGTASIDGDVYADADVDPLVIEINGDSSSGQVFSVGDTINVEGYVHSVANASVDDVGEYLLETTLSCDLWLNPGNLEHDWHYEASNATSSNYTEIVNEYDSSLSFTHTLTTPGVYSITLDSVTSASISFSGSGSPIMGSYDSAQETLSFTVTEGRLFMVDGGNSTIYELDPSTGTVLNTIPTPTATDGGGDGLAYGNGRMFFTTIDTDDIYEINPSSGAILNQFTGPVTWEGIDALGFSGDRLYALGYGDNATIHVLHPDSGANITTLEPGIPLIGGLTFAGTRDSLFVSNNGGEPVPSLNMTNQGFEAGNFTGWNVYTGSGGYASVETSWESWNGTVYYPEMGAHFALLENGAQNQSTYISQNFTIDAGEIIEGRAFFSTEEDYADETFNDECSVDIMNGATLVQTVFSADTYDPDYPDTPWSYWSWEAPSGGTYTLVARVVNIGDSSVSSYMGLDMPEEEPNTIYEIDDETGAVLNSFPAPVGSGYGLYGLGFSSSRNTLFLGFWEPDIVPDIVYEVDPDDGTVINSFVGPAGTAISALAADEFVAAAGPIVNGSFETGDYTGWTLLEFSAYDGHAADCGTWGIASDGQTISCNDSAWDFFDEILVEQCPVSSITYHASDGEYLAYQLQNCEETHRMYQDITLSPCATTLYWDMWYTNWPGEFDSGNQSLAVHIRDVSDDSIKATLFQTINGTSPVAINMTPFSADISAFAGQTVRLDVTLNEYWGPLDAAFDNFRIRSSADQGNDGTSNWYTIYGYRPSGQEFVPSESNLEGVEVYIQGSDLYDGFAEMTVNIRSGNITGPIVASKTQVLHETKPDQSTGGWVYFQFDAPTSVSIGNLYVLELSSNRLGHAWSSAGTNSYADGSAIRSGDIHADTDYAFRTTYGCTGVCSSGPNSGTGSHQHAGGVFYTWQNPENIAASDNMDAEVTLIDGSASHYLRASNFSFNIDPSVLITGIQVTVERSANSTVDGGISDYVVSLVDETGTVLAGPGTNLAKTSDAWTTSDNTITYGGPSELWGGTWNCSDINDPDFGVVIQVRNLGPTGNPPIRAEVDYVTITVYHTCPTSDNCEPITYISSTSKDNGAIGATTANLTIDKPALTSPGDILIAGITVWGGTDTTIEHPSGWTLINRINNFAHVGMATYYRVADSSDNVTTSYSWRLSSGSAWKRAAGGISLYTGVDPSDPIDVYGGASASNDTTVAPSVTTTVANDMIIAVFGVRYGSLGDVSGMEIAYNKSNGADVCIRSEYTMQYTAGTTTTYSSSIGLTKHWVAQTIALKPECVADTPPVANNNTVGTSEDTPMSFMDCQFPYSDVDGDLRTAVKIMSLPAHGTLKYLGSAFTIPFSITEADISNLTFEPAANENGSPYTNFGFQVQAGGAWSTNTANMTIAVTPVNDAPIAVADCSYTTNEDTTLIVGFGGGLLSNDLDIDGPSLTVHNFTLPSHGTLSMDPSADGSFNYTPYSGYNGTDGFTYRATDGSAESNWANVCILIYAANEAPVITEGDSTNVTMSEDGWPTDFSLTLHATDANGDTVTWSISSPASHGSAVASGTGPAKDIDYGPTPDYWGSDTFNVTVTDGQGGSDTIVVFVTIESVNDPPVNTVPGAQNTYEDTSKIFSGGNAISVADVDVAEHIGGDLEVTLSVLHGTLTLSGTTGLLFSVGDGVSDATMNFTSTAAVINTALDGLIYSPTPNYNGSETLTIITSDQGYTGYGGVQVDTDTVSITVDAVNDAPSGADNTVTTPEDTDYVFSIGDFGFTDPNDSPPDSLLAIKITTLPLEGSLENDGSSISAGDYIPSANISAGHLVFVPDPDENGTAYASFTFQVQDDGGTVNCGVDLDQSANTMTIDVTPTNDCPVIDSVSPETQTVQFSDLIQPITITAHDIDSDLGELSLGYVPFGLSVDDSTPGTWIISGQFMDDHAMDWIIGVTDGECETPAATITSLEECVVVRFDNHNPMSVEIDDAGDLLTAEFTVHIKQSPDGYLGWADLASDDVEMNIVPVSGGGAIHMAYNSSSDLDKFSDGAPVSFTFVPESGASFAIGTYIIEVTVISDYYKVCGGAESLLMVYDPDVGASGAGTFENCGDTYSFAFLVNYNKKGKNLRGSLVVIRELSGGGIYRIKSNALYDLALIEDPAIDVATFSGKCTYIGPDVLNDEMEPQNVGGQEFVVYLEDYDTSSGLSGTPDRFWFTVLGRDFTLDFNSNNRADSGEIMEIDGDIIIPDMPANVGRVKHNRD